MHTLSVSALIPGTIYFCTLFFVLTMEVKVEIGI